MRILVTGGAGFIGSHLVDKLATKQYHHVTVWDNFCRFKNPDTYHYNKYAQYKCVDIRYVDQYEFKEDSFDVIYHLAAISRVFPCYDFDLAYDVNVNGTKNMLDVANNCDARFIFASSCAAKEPYLNKYGFTKFMGEELCRYYQKNCAFYRRVNIARLHNVYGPREYDTLLANLTECKEKNKKIKVYHQGRQKRDYIHVEDVCNALVALGHQDHVHVECDIGHEVYTTSKVVKMFGIEPDYKKTGRYSELERVKADIRHTKKILHPWKPTIKLKTYLNELGNPGLGAK
jgi:UDP-glucose 4-epimerase